MKNFFSFSFVIYIIYPMSDLNTVFPSISTWIDVSRK